MRAILKVDSFYRLAEEVCREEFGEDFLEQVRDTYTEDQVYLAMARDIGPYIKEVLNFERDLQEGSHLEEILNDLVDELHDCMPKITEHFSKMFGVNFCFEGVITGVSFLGYDNMALVEFK